MPDKKGRARKGTRPVFHVPFREEERNVSVKTYFAAAFLAAAVVSFVAF